MSISKSKKKVLDNAMAQINKKFAKEGSVTVVDYCKNKEKELTVRFYRTPSYEVNIMLGGGMGVGRIIELYGNNSCGKTSLALETVAYNQKLDKEFVAGYFETEASYDPEYAKMLGVDTDRLLYWDQRDFSGAEQGLEVLRGVVASGACNMVIINSVAGLSPEEENVKDLSKSQVGTQARLMSKLMRVIVGIAAKTGTTLVFINQIREKVGVMFGDNTTTSGGRALAFYATQRVKMAKYQIDAKTDPIKAEDGIKVHCKAVKNRLAKGNPFKETDYFAEYGQGINSLYELPAILNREGITRSGGAWTYYDNANGEPDTIEGILCKFNGKKAFIKTLSENEKFRKFFEDKVYEALEKGSAGKEISSDDTDVKEAESLEEEAKRIDEEVAASNE